MPTIVKVCPYCSKPFERRLGKQCPHCLRDIVQGLRKCPECSHIFKLCKSKKQDAKGYFCPNCHIELHMATGRMKGQVLLRADFECAKKIVELVELTISMRGNIVFAFEGSERNAELVHAYALVDRSKTFLRKQPDSLGLSPHDFTIELVETMLRDVWWRENIKSLVMVRNQVGKFAQDLFRDKKLRHAQNEARKATFVDYTVLEAVWN